jgi:hypothetical protein
MTVVHLISNPCTVPSDVWLLIMVPIMMSLVNPGFVNIARCCDLDVHVHKGNRKLLLRCGTIDGAHKGFNPLEPDQSSVNGIPVSYLYHTCIQMEALLLRQPGHRMFVVRVTDNSSDDPCLASLTPGTSTQTDDLTPAIKKVLQNFKDCFPLELPSALPPDRGVGHTIALDPGSRPVHRAIYRLSPAERVDVKSTVEALLSKGLIDPSSSPFGSPILFVAKKDGSLRMVIDYRVHNRLNIRNHTPLPRIDDLFDRVQGAAVFTSLDLTSGYHQISITEDDRAQTAFLTPSRSYQFRVLPFGLNNAPATLAAYSFWE